MTLLKVKDILKHATENKYGVAALNTINFETIKYAILAAEQERVPIIIQFYPGLDTYIPLTHIAYMAKDLARKAAVPVGVHLDHSASFAIAVGGIRDGFPSVMVDGSVLSFEENVKLTKKVAEIAGIFGVDIEAELGHVGNGTSIDDIENTDHYTNVQEAVDFVAATGCDSLAVAVGNAHGAYVTTPHLDFKRISELRSSLDIPLVLHGCSDIPDEQLSEAVNLGMSKFNVATEYFRAMYHAFEDVCETKEADGNGIELLDKIGEPMIDFVTKKIRLLNPNKYSL